MSFAAVDDRDAEASILEPHDGSAIQGVVDVSSPVKGPDGDDFKLGVEDEEEEDELIPTEKKADGEFFKDDYGEGLKRFPGIFGGIVDDYKRRLPWYWTDIWDDAMNRKTPAAALMMFLATFCSTVALGSAIDRATNGSIGIAEYLLMNGVAGMAHSLFGCQPLLILRPTGPITLMITQIYSLSNSLQVDFYTLLAWTGWGIGIWMTLIAAFELSRHIAMLTTFAHDVFACFVSSIYVVDGIKGIVSRFEGTDALQEASPVFALMISLWLIFVAFVLSFLRNHSHLLPKQVRFLLADYALGIATITATALSFSYGGRVSVDRLPVADTDSLVGWVEPSPTADRAWPVNMFTTEKAWLAAIMGFVVSIPITIFFYFDQNFSSLLCQVDEMGLRKGKYYHTSLWWMGIFNFACPMFGFPFVTGSLPHSPQMVKALRNDEVTRGENGPAVSENRIAPFIMYSAILFSYLLFAGIIELIPVAAADAVLIFVGLEGIIDTRLFERLPVLITPDNEIDPANSSVACAARKFTLLQLLVLGAGWGLNFTPAALAFPLVIACLVPIRFYLLPWMFTQRELRILDSEDKDVKEGKPTADKKMKDEKSF